MVREDGIKRVVREGGEGGWYKEGGKRERVRKEGECKEREG